ncbi:Dynein light chain-related protein [Sarocladium implicatum]|nr:Dynein light chain-related protein [Sarocladium implicatum]
MADPNPVNGQDALEEKLGRLTRKPGVRASLVLDRQSGAILKTSGDASALLTAKSRTTSTATTLATSEAPTTEDNESQGMEDFAAMIWTFVKQSSQFVENVDQEDEMRLLRLRTRKQELVIVPDPKYLLVVVHETPTA